MTARILIVDDDTLIRESLYDILTRDGYEASAVESGEAALAAIAAQTFDLVLIDLHLTGIGGLEVLAAIRRQSPDTIVIILTGYGSLDTAVTALRHGAHDYLMKPVKPATLRESIQNGLLSRQQKLRQRELLRQLEQRLADSLANVRASMTEQPPPPEADSVTQELEETLLSTSESARHQRRFLQKGRFIVDFTRHLITLDGQALELSPTEFDLLTYLIRQSPAVVSPQKLAREVLGYESEAWEANELVRQHIYRIRRKVKQATGQTEMIRTVRGVGYAVGEP